MPKIRLRTLTHVQHPNHAKLAVAGKTTFVDLDLAIAQKKTALLHATLKPNVILDGARSGLLRRNVQYVASFRNTGQVFSMGLVVTRYKAFPYIFAGEAEALLEDSVSTRGGLRIYFDIR